MLSQAFDFRSVDAHEISNSFICVSTLKSSKSFFVKSHHAEVCPLSRRVTLKPLSAPLQDGIRFFPIPVPASRSAFPLRSAYLFRRRDTGFPCSDVSDKERMG